MADSNLLIQRLELDPADFPPLPLQPGFAQLVTDTLGNVATPTDGFDDVMGEAIAIVDALDTALGGLALDLLSSFAEADAIDAAPVSDTAAGFTASLAPSSAAVDALGVLLGSATGPVPPVPCDLNTRLPDTVQAFTIAAIAAPLAGIPPSPLVPVSVSYSLGVFNASAQALNITKVVFTTPAGDILSASVPVPQTVQPGGEIQGRITVTTARLGDFTATLAVTIDIARKATVICYAARVVAAATGTGGSGGGGSFGGCQIVAGSQDIKVVCGIIKRL